jgi:hypothetical protein
MIFASIKDKPKTQELLSVLEKHFGKVEWGDQGTLDMPDAYFWVERDSVKVAVDNLTALEFQVKCSETSSPLIREVISVLSRAYRIEILDEPELEAHE